MNEAQSNARVPPSMLPSLLGTWTLQTRASADLGLYKASAFFVMHVMQDPLQFYACSLEDCDEHQNRICQRNLDQCVDVDTTISQWSDVSIFYQFGFDVETGTYPFRTRIVQNTSDWIGPYNLILPQHNYQLTSRYVATIATDYLQPPVNQTLTPPTLFDIYAGATAVHSTIRQQPHFAPTKDPYEKQFQTCANGDIHPVLPQFTLSHNKDFAIEFPLLSWPSSKDSLYKTWPAIQKHLPDFPVVGPYCFQGDRNRAYAINISFATTKQSNNTWKLTPGCVPDLPCWTNRPAPKPDGGGNNGPDDNSTIIWNALMTYGIYFLLFAFVISLTVNCQLSYQVQRLREHHSGTHNARRRTRPHINPAGDEELEAPLLLPSEATTDPESTSTLPVEPTPTPQPEEG